MAKKYKKGDKVITNKFRSNKIDSFTELMKPYVGKSGKITAINDRGYFIVHPWNWPESALTLDTNGK